MEQNFAMQHLVSQPLAVVEGMLTDLAAFGHLHPLMDHVESLGQGRYRVHEFKPLPFGLKIRFHYEALVSIETETSSILYEAWPNGMKIEIRFKLTKGPDANSTRVQEDVRIQGFMLFIGILKKAITESHPRIFASIKI